MAIQDTSIPEILLIDKPAGMTSFDVIRTLRKQTGLKKFGHTGTLDPAATGLLVLGVGSGTKQLTALTKLDKEYEAAILLGVSTTTSDRDGKVLDHTVVDASTVTAERVQTVLDVLVGELELPVSAYSAIKRDGVPMYKRARAAAARGEVVTDLPLRVMRVYEAEVRDVYPKTFQDYVGMVVRVRFVVGSGTYIRSLAEEAGRRLGVPAMLLELRRTKVGEFGIEQALQLGDIKNEPAAN